MFKKRILIKLFYENASKSDYYYLQCNANETIADVKNKLSQSIVNDQKEQLAFSPQDIHLIYSGNEIKNESTVNDLELIRKNRDFKHIKNYQSSPYQDIVMHARAPRGFHFPSDVEVNQSFSIHRSLDHNKNAVNQSNIDEQVAWNIQNEEIKNYALSSTGTGSTLYQNSPVAIQPTHSTVSISDEELEQIKTNIYKEFLNDFNSLYSKENSCFDKWSEKIGNMDQMNIAQLKNLVREVGTYSTKPRRCFFGCSLFAGTHNNSRAALTSLYNQEKYKFDIDDKFTSKGLLECLTNRAKFSIHSPCKACALGGDG